VTGGSNLSASAKLDFSVIIPRVLFLQVGTGTTSPYSDNLAVDSIAFSVPTGSIGTGSMSGTGGDLTNGAVTVRVLGNGGDVGLTNSVNGPLGSGNALNPTTVAWSDISVTSAALASGTPGFSPTAITHPTFNTAVTGGSSAAVALPAASGVVRREGSWTFAYANNKVLPAGTYGTAANNGRVTYTASMP